MIPIIATINVNIMCILFFVNNLTKNHIIAAKIRITPITIRIIPVVLGIIYLDCLLRLL